MNKQECAIKYVEDNYLQFNRLRHDIIADKLQVRCAHPIGDRLSAPQKSADFSGTPQAKGERREAKGKRLSAKVEEVMR